jgi:transposase
VDTMEDAKPAIRRHHGRELKKVVLDECSRPGASVARIALSHGLNANLVHKWRREATRAQAAMSAEPAPSFIPLPVVTAAGPAEIHVELRRGPLAVKVSWPASAMAECAGWLRELLR